jgi:hypothetical protein
LCVWWEEETGKEEGTQKVFLLPRKYINIPKKKLATPDDFQKDVLHRTASKYYNRSKFPTVGIVSKGSGIILLTCSQETT